MDERENMNLPGERLDLDHFGNLQGRKYMSLATLRKSGEAVATPVWFAATPEGSLRVTTYEGTGKVKRIKNNPSVTVAPCERSGRVLGPAVEGKAGLLSELEGREANRLLREKYGLIYSVFKLFLRVSGRGDGVYLEVSPPNEASDDRNGPVEGR